MKVLINIICFCIPFSNIRRKFREYLKNKFIYSAVKDTNTLIKKLKKNLPIILWIDHSLGGGTETYTKNQFNELKKTNNIIRMQYWPWIKKYSLTVGINTNTTVYIQDLSEIENFCKTLNISKIVVNNLVSYANSFEILDFVKRIKRNTHVSFRGHDFYSLCPSFNLLDCDGKFCNFTHCHGCEHCWKNIKMLFKADTDTIKTWREQWGNFFTETVDELIVFSEKIKEMFIYIYPQLTDKIIVVPHKTRTYPIVKISKHNDINIAVLGNITQPKGRDVIIEMSKHLNKTTNIIVIGTMAEAPSNIKITGKYNPSDLPKLIKKHNINIVFIPSIWPETFSYTTSEAISMGLPVACYNMGAPSERIGKYDQGLVLEKISPAENLTEIIEFVKNTKGKK